MSRNNGIRNIAIIAHVDHGKTTLVDGLFKQSGVFRSGQQVDDRVMDSMDLERERGITIAAKNCAINWKDVKINIIDTPGHADFGGEVERALSMVDGVILLVDASEGPLPQTRFVLSKALEQGLPVIVVINKIDRHDARPLEVIDEITDLLIDLDATEEQLDFPLLYAIGRDGIVQKDLDTPGENLHPLLDLILEEIPAPRVGDDSEFSMLVSDLSYSEYLGRLAVGRVFSGAIENNSSLIAIDAEGNRKNLKVSKLQGYDGLKMVPSNKAVAGDIIILAGVDEIHIGDTIATTGIEKALPRISIDDPTVSMLFTNNTSPFSGLEGKFVQSSKIRERLEKETLRNVSMKIEDCQEGILVQGRGEFQMVILIEQMRREGFEFCVGRPEVIYKEIDGKRHEPIEHLFVDCEENYLGVVSEKLMSRKGLMLNMVNHQTGRVRVEFSVPSRSLIGYRDEFLTDTRGTGIMNSYVSGYEKHRGDFPTRHTGSLVSALQGSTNAYALFNLEPRGVLFVTPGVKTYEGMIVGEHNRDNDLDVNPCKEKKLTNVRAAAKDENLTLAPVIPMTLEKAIQFIREDEFVEVTPENIRLRKKELSATQRRVAAKRKNHSVRMDHDNNRQKGFNRGLCQRIIDIR